MNKSFQGAALAPSRVPNENNKIAPDITMIGQKNDIQWKNALWAGGSVSDFGVAPQSRKFQLARQ